MRGKKSFVFLFLFLLHLTGGLSYSLTVDSLMVDIQKPTAAGTIIGSGFEIGANVALTPGGPFFVGSYDLPQWKFINSVYVSGNYAYAAASSLGLLIIDVSDPSAPTLKGSYDVPQNKFNSGIFSVYVSGNYAYVAGGSLGFLIIDVSDPSAPTLKGSYDIEKDITGDVYVSGNYAYVAGGSLGLLIIDVSDPSAPTLKGSYDVLGKSITDVYVSGNYAYIFSLESVSRPGRDYSDFLIIDITSASAPTLKGSYKIYTRAVEDVYVSGNYAYVAGEDGLLIIDVSDPSALTLKGSYYGGYGVYTGVYVLGDYAYVAYTSVLSIIDVSDPSAPARKDALTPGDAKDVYVLGDYAYVAGEDGLLMINVGDLYVPSSPVEELPIDNPVDVYVSGNYAYVAGFTSLNIVDISDPSAPTLKGAYVFEPAITIKDVYVSGNYAYVASFTSLNIVDISDPSAPTLKGSYDVPQNKFNSGIFSVYVSGNYAYISAGTSGLQIVDISDPSAPILKGFYETSGETKDVYVLGGYVYVTNSASGLLIIDVSDPSAPILKGSYNTSGVVNSLYVSGDYAYFGFFKDRVGLQIVDVSDPSAPISKEFYKTSQVNGIHVVNNYVYVVDIGFNFQMIPIITNMVTLNQETITASFPTSLPAGHYNVVVTNPDGEKGYGYNKLKIKSTPSFFLYNLDTPANKEYSNKSKVFLSITNMDRKKIKKWYKSETYYNEIEIENKIKENIFDSGEIVPHEFTDIPNSCLHLGGNKVEKYECKLYLWIIDENDELSGAGSAFIIIDVIAPRLSDTVSTDSNTVKIVFDENVKADNSKISINICENETCNTTVDTLTIIDKVCQDDTCILTTQEGQSSGGFYLVKIENVLDLAENPIEDTTVIFGGYKGKPVINTFDLFNEGSPNNKNYTNNLTVKVFLDTSDDGNITKWLLKEDDVPPELDDFNIVDDIHVFNENPSSYILQDTSPGTHTVWAWVLDDNSPIKNISEGEHKHEIVYDIELPSLDKAESQNDTTVIITFNEAVNKENAKKIDYYSIYLEESENSSLLINSVNYVDGSGGKKYRITTSNKQKINGKYIIEVMEESNIYDLAANLIDIDKKVKFDGFNGIAPTINSFVLRATNNGNSVYTNKVDVLVDITESEDVKRWLITEDSIPPEISDFKSTSKPNTFILSDLEGSHDVFVWVLDNYDLINDPNIPIKYQIILDKTSPEIKHITPTNNAINILRETDITVEFSEPIDINSFSMSVEDSDKNSVNGAIVWDGNNAIFKPRETLAYEKKYTIITKSVKDLTGNSFSGLNVSTFQTMDLPEAASFQAGGEDGDNSSGGGGLCFIGTIF